MTASALLVYQLGPLCPLVRFIVPAAFWLGTESALAFRAFCAPEHDKRPLSVLEDVPVYLERLIVSC